MAMELQKIDVHELAAIKFYCLSINYINQGIQKIQIFKNKNDQYAVLISYSVQGLM